ncbi:hypothetical protein BDF21DRAFT_416265 [Thamnidium elegans]|uniref:Uncharacterized protein n=1 Tax=Thamnidium elegans TaxID=101142 RepID=A0A8H7VSU3_9FUNG|nr:hypothetical protein INT48_003733 [Thamnidium elegans]KAI8083596.1 hypothetical protein BDF21DRAFT_416265 [Thamnidium elegans]
MSSRKHKKSHESDRHSSNSSKRSSKRAYDSDESSHKRSSKRRGSDTTDHLPDSLKSTITPITEDAYFEKSTEFRLWLKEHKHKYIDEISSKESRRYFKKFVTKWNDFELDAKFYKGVNSTQLSSSDSTRFKWSFAKKIDQSELDSVRDSVDSMTALSRGEDKLKRRANVGPTMPTIDTFNKEKKLEAEHAQRKYEQKKSRERRTEALDEVAPRETGREAQIAKKRALNAYHKREPSPDIELSEADLMGGDDFKARLAAERRANEVREARRKERQDQRLAPTLGKMDEYKAKENATMEMFRKMAEENKRRRE